MIFSPTSISR